MKAPNELYEKRGELQKELDEISKQIETEESKPVEQLVEELRKEVRKLKEELDSCKWYRIITYPCPCPQEPSPWKPYWTWETTYSDESSPDTVWLPSIF